MESHLLGYRGNLYGVPARVDFYHFIRPEIKFDSFEELSEQIDIKNQFGPLSTFIKKVTWQRLGYILEHVIEEKEMADALFDQLRTIPGTLMYMPLSILAEDNPSNRDSRWKININIQIETDDI